MAELKLLVCSEGKCALTLARVWQTTGMHLPNVIGFFGMGFVMEVLPRFAADAVISETRLLWLTAMGAVMMMIGGAYLVRMAWETLPRENYYAAVRGIFQEGIPPASMRSEVVEKTRARG